MFNQFIIPIILVITITLPIWVFVRIRRNRLTKPNQHKTNFKFELILGLFYLYAVSVLAVTIVPIPLSKYKRSAPRGINLVPVVYTAKDFVATFAPEYRYRMEPSLDNILGNIILFMPLGFLLPLLSDKLNSLKKIIIIALICSVSIEFIQFIFRTFKIYRTVDIDDVILNVSGAIAGFFIYRLPAKHNLLAVIEKRSHKINSRKNDK